MPFGTSVCPERIDDFRVEAEPLIGWRNAHLDRPVLGVPRTDEDDSLGPLDGLHDHAEMVGESFSDMPET